jgi:hypothetical protein
MAPVLKNRLINPCLRLTLVGKVLLSNSCRLVERFAASVLEREGKTRVIDNGSRVRKTKRTANRCQHHVGPVVVEREERGHIGRCLKCGTAGPACETVEEAYRELRYPRLRYPKKDVKALRGFRR